MDKQAFIDQWLHHWSSFDIENLVACYHSDMSYLDPSLNRPINKQEFLIYLEKLKRKFNTWEWKRIELFGDKDRYCLKWVAKFPNNTTIHGLDIVEFKDGLIKRNEVYFDQKQLY